MSEVNLYQPYLMKIASITDEAPGVKTFRLEFADADAARQFTFKAGQFAALPTTLQVGFVSLDPIGASTFAASMTSGRGSGFASSGT